jgi:3-deoxy-D-manno-octulosonic-acid transferase
VRFLYTLVLLLLAPFVFAWFTWRTFRQTGSPDKLGERLGSSPYMQPGVAIWVHGASVGEIRAAAPLINALHRLHPERPLLVTSFTGSGRRQARQLFGDRAVVSLMPYDLPFFVSRWFNCTQPVLAVIMETEIWPNLYAACAKRRIPLLLMSARMSERSFLRYQRYASLVRGALRQATVIAAQSAVDAARFRLLGADEARLSVLGNLKFDLSVSDDALSAGAALRIRLFGNAAVWVAGSTREGEEALLLDAFRQVLQHQPDTVLVLAPRHPERAAAVAAFATTAGFTCRRLTAGEQRMATGEVLLVDVLGQLIRFYAAGDVAFVGGTLVPVGGHNLLEPAALGLPVLAGPHLDNVGDMAEMMREAGVLTEVRDAASLAQAVVWLLGNPATRTSIGCAAREQVMQNRGALQRALTIIGAHLKPR